jgi:hypothetical protein
MGANKNRSGRGASQALSGNLSGDFADRSFYGPAVLRGRDRVGCCSSSRFGNTKSSGGRNDGNVSGDWQARQQRVWPAWSLPANSR